MSVSAASSSNPATMLTSTTSTNQNGMNKWLFFMEKMERDLVEKTNNRRSDDEAQKLQNIFPKTVWLLVFEKLPDPATIENTSNSSIFFRSLLKPALNIALFPKVFRILLSHHYSSSTEDRLLILRLICKFWNMTIDNFYQLQPITSNIFMVNHFSFQLKASRRTAASRFLQHFSPTHDFPPGRNPFLGRKVVVYHAEDDDEFSDDQSVSSDSDSDQALQPINPKRQLGRYTATRNIFSKYGLHIWYLSLQSFGGYNLPRQEFVRLLSLLRFTPNLRELQLYINSVDWNMVEDKTPLVIPHLQSLQLLAVRNLKAYIFNPLIKSNGQITSLTVSGGEQDLGEYDWRVVEMEKLETLELYGVSEREVGVVLGGAGGGNRLPKLEKLSIGLKEGLEVNLEGILEMVRNGWGGGLKELMVDFGGGIYRRRVLPNLEGMGMLERLEVVMPGVYGLDFLEGAKDTLRWLRVEFREGLEEGGMRQVAKEMEEKVRFVEFFENPLKSNIWEVMTKLEEIKCGGVGGNREQDKRWTRRMWREQKRKEGNKKTAIK